MKPKVYSLKKTRSLKLLKSEMNARPLIPKLTEIKKTVL